jgi:ribonucleotide monophosphatase NagD (HAD superfamily)
MSYPSFFDIAKEFKVIMLDSYGVVKNHNGLIKGAEKTLDFIRREKKLFRILTLRSKWINIQSLVYRGLSYLKCLLPG